MFSIFLTILSSFFYATLNILEAHIAGKIFKKITTTAFYNVVGNIIAIPILLCFGTPKLLPLDFEILWVLGAILLIEFICQFPYYKAIKSTDTSIVTAMFSIGKILIPFLAFFMVSEKLESLQYFGFFMVIFANLILNLNFKELGKKKLVINISFFMMLLVSIGLSVQSVLNKKILMEIDWITFIFWYIILNFLMNFLILLIPGAKQDIFDSFGVYVKKWRYFLFVELINSIGFILVRVALVSLPVVVLRSITSIQPIFVLIIGFVLYRVLNYVPKESLSSEEVLKKIICFIFIILGVILTIN